MENGKITSETEVSTPELACVLGITGRRIRQLAEDGVLERQGLGKFDLCKSVKRYIDYLTREAADEDKMKMEKAKNQSEITLKASKAAIAQLEAKELQGQMHRSEDVAAMTEDLIFAIRSMLVALPGRLAIDACTARTPAEASEVIRKEVYAVMEELSKYKYDPKKYEERVRERRSWTANGRDDDED